nr:MAG TPA: hypothetical protein [Caudoviricetes sp.]
MDFSICHFDGKSICQTLIHIIVRQFRFISFIDDFKIDIHGSAIELLRCIFNGNSCFIRWTAAKAFANQITFQNTVHRCLVFILPRHAICQWLPGGVFDFCGWVCFFLFSVALFPRLITFDAATVHIVCTEQFFGFFRLHGANKQQQGDAKYFRLHIPFLCWGMFPV